MADLIQRLRQLAEQTKSHVYVYDLDSRETMEQAATELEALRKRCEAVEADAARYRWLRHKLTCGHFATDEEVAFLDAKDGASLDTAIDQAIAAAQEPSHG